jgi:hypothetical protein
VLHSGGLPGSIPGSPVPRGAHATTAPTSTTLHCRTSMASPGGRQTVRTQRPAVGHGPRLHTSAAARLGRPRASALYASTGYTILYAGSGCCLHPSSTDVQAPHPSRDDRAMPLGSVLQLRRVICTRPSLPTPLLP